MSKKSPSSKDHAHNLRFAVLATDVVCFQIINNRLSILLGKVKTVPVFKDKWALIGGLILPTETADQSVERHLFNKAGIQNVYKEQLYTFSSIDRDPRGRVVSVGYIALDHKNLEESEIANLDTKWCPVENLPALAYDHDIIAHTAVQRLRAKIGYTNIAQYLLPHEFTMSDLQGVYECVLGKRLDKRNFRKKVLASGLLRDLKLTRKKGVMRPATLYSFAKKETEFINIL